jgi:hypothetical protein
VALTTRILLRLDFGLRQLTTKHRSMWNWSIDSQFSNQTNCLTSSNIEKSNRSKIRVVSGLTLYHGDTLIFDYHLIFNLFEVLFNYIILFYIYTWILVIKSTLLMSLDVGKSWQVQILKVVTIVIYHIN